MESLGLLSLSSSSSAIGKKFPSKLDRPCHFCGEPASPDICVTCCICKVSHVHLYCLHKKLATVSEKWYCEECKTLSSFQLELPDQLAIHATWKGSFEILDSVLMGGTYEGLQAHLSWKVRHKVYEAANAMPNVLQLKLYPHSDVWPEEFKRLSPTVDDIALYFLPGDDERSRKAYHLLSNVLMTRDSAIQSSLNGFELLIFSSKQLPTNSQRINKNFFLWGVFQSVGKRYSSSQASVRNQLKSISSALCNNDYGTKDGSPNIIKADDFTAVKMETDIIEENTDQRIDKADLSSSYPVEKRRKVDGAQGPLLTPKVEQLHEFDSPLGFMTPITSDSYATDPSLLLGGPPGFTRPEADVGYATSPALLLETPPSLTPKVEQPGEFDGPPRLRHQLLLVLLYSLKLLLGLRHPNTKAGDATNSALLMEGPPGFCTPVNPNKRGDSSDETNQKVNASDTVEAVALWDSRRQRSARGTATANYNRDSSSQPQKPTKVTETPVQAELLSRYHRSHGSTGMGIMHRNFVVISGDGKSFISDLVEDLRYPKVQEHVGGGIRMWSALAGEKHKCAEAANLIPGFLEQAGQHHDQLNSFRERLEAAPGVKHDWIFVFGGFQIQDAAHVPFLFTVEPGESKYGQTYYTCGSGAHYASHVLQRIQFTDALTVDVAVIWVERALVYASIMDHLTGGRAIIKVIVDGVDQRDEKPWIFDKLLKKHIGYFKEAHERNESDVVARRVCQFYNSSPKLKNKWIHGERFMNDGLWMDFTPADYANQDSEEVDGLDYDTEEVSDGNTDEPAPTALGGAEEPPSKKAKTEGDSIIP